MTIEFELTRDLTERLAQLLQSLSRDQLLAIAQSARKLGRPDATQAIALVLEEIALP